MRVEIISVSEVIFIPECSSDRAVLNHWQDLKGLSNAKTIKIWLNKEILPEPPESEHERFYLKIAFPPQELT